MARDPLLLVSLLIGTNNLGHGHSPEATSQVRARVRVRVRVRLALPLTLALTLTLTPGKPQYAQLLESLLKAQTYVP